MENKVYLGGTWNGSKWREKLIPMLKIDHFNPVVPDWTEKCQLEEERQKDICKYHLYVITPRMLGCFSIAEVIDSSNKNPNGTILCILNEDSDDNPCMKLSFDVNMMKSLNAVRKMVVNNGAHAFASLKQVSEFLNEV